MMNAVGKWLENNKTPGRKVSFNPFWLSISLKDNFTHTASSHQVKQIDNRGSNFYVALYWAEELAAKDPSWAPLAQVSVFLEL